MVSRAAGREAGVCGDAPVYARRRPERTLLYQIIEEYYPELEQHLASRGSGLPRYVAKEFEAFLDCGRLERGFLRVRCGGCGLEHLVAFSCKRRGFCPACGARRMAETAAHLADAIFPDRPVRQWVLSVPYPLRFLFASRPQVMSGVLGIVYRAIAGHLARKAGKSRRRAKTGAVTLVQRFGGALNLNVHFHMLFLDGVFVESSGSPVFRGVAAPTTTELAALVEKIASRVGRHLERRGLVTRDAENAYLTEDAMGADDDGDPMAALRGASITYRVAVGRRQGQKAFTVQTVPASADERAGDIGKAGGFSLHAGVYIGVGSRSKLERLCRYVSRPALSEERLSLTSNGNIRYRLKTPYRDGTTHVVLEPLDFLARLAALVPPPRVNLTRYHGVFAPNSHWRERVTPNRRVEGRGVEVSGDTGTEPTGRAGAMSWAQRLKRVFGIDIEKCSRCGGAVRIVASIENPAVIRRILDHLESRERAMEGAVLPGPRAPPQLSLFE